MTASMAFSRRPDVWPLVLLPALARSAKPGSECRLMRFPAFLAFFAAGGSLDPAQPPLHKPRSVLRQGQINVKASRSRPVNGSRWVDMNEGLKLESKVQEKNETNLKMKVRWD